MTHPNHHPSESLVLDHARGVLEYGRDLVIRAHLSACPECRAAVALAEAVGGALVDELAPAEMAADALARALVAIDAGPPPQPPAASAPLPPDWIRVPADVLHAARRNRRLAAPGVWVAKVAGGGRVGARSYLLGVGKGIAVPRHTHLGSEFVCVVKGAFTDRGHTYGPGDFAESDEEIEHEPRVTDDGECVCLVACDNRLVPRSLMARVFRPFVGI
jgi:putative transcriptional regulator